MSTPAIERQRQEIYEIAEAIAPTWERRRAEIEAAVAPVRHWMLRELAPRAGDTVLELGAGVGDTGFDAAEIIGEPGRLISTDFSPAMVAAARRRGADRGLDNVEYRVMDAERIELDDDSVDGVLCRLAYMLMPEPGAALAETRRVLRLGGRVSLAVWGALDRNPYFTIAAGILVAHGHLPPLDPSGDPAVSMASADRTAVLLEDAGFPRVRTEEVAVHFEVPDAAGYLSMVADTAGPLGLALRDVAATDRAAIEAAVAEPLARFSTGRGYEIPGVALCAVAE